MNKIFYRRTHGSGNNTSTETDSYSNHEVYTKQKLVVHSGPSLPPVVMLIITGTMIWIGDLTYEF